MSLDTQHEWILRQMQELIRYVRPMSPDALESIRLDLTLLQAQTDACRQEQQRQTKRRRSNGGQARAQKHRDTWAWATPHLEQAYAELVAEGARPGRERLAMRVYRLTRKDIPERILREFLRSKN